MRNPLAPIRNAVAVLRSKGASPADIEWCRELIDRQVEHMGRLMDDLFDVPRIACDKLELRTEKITLASVIDRAIETSLPHVESASQKLNVSLISEPVWIDADSVRISQVFSNLLNNAVKYTPRVARSC